MLRILADGVICNSQLMTGCIDGLTVGDCLKCTLRQDQRATIVKQLVAAMLPTYISVIAVLATVEPLDQFTLSHPSIMAPNVNMMRHLYLLIFKPAP